MILASLLFSFQIYLASFLSNTIESLCVFYARSVRNLYVMTHRLRIEWESVILYLIEIKAN